MGKIAIQLFGHMRTFKQCHRALVQNLLKQYDCDIFIHTWDTLDHNTKTWHTFRMGFDMTPEQLRRAVINVFHPVAMQMETQHPIDMMYVDSDGFTISKYGLYAMLHSMVTVNTLRQDYQRANNTKYDAVVMLRPDVRLLTSLNLDRYINGRYPSNAWYTAGRVYDVLNNLQYAKALDVLFLANPDVMDTVFKNMPVIWNQILNPKTTKYSPEYSLICAIENLGIPVFLINYLLGRDFKIKRYRPNLLRRLFG